MQLLSPAKINLLLKIGNPRQDGYHSIYSIFAMLNFGDEIHIDFSTPEFILNFPINIPDKSNIIFKTYVFLKKRFNLHFGIRIDVKKNIPTGAGLGGGSSNAAILIYTVLQKFGVPITADLYSEISTDIGADVPAFLYYLIHKKPYLLVRGIGHSVISIPSTVKYKFLLINPGYSISTKWAYSNFPKKLTNPLKLYNSIEYYSKILNDGFLNEILENDFESLLFERYKKYRLIRNILHDFGIYSLITGSGSVIFGLIPDESIGLKAQNELKSQGFWTRMCNTI